MNVLCTCILYAEFPKRTWGYNFKLHVCTYDRKTILVLYIQGRCYFIVEKLSSAKCPTSDSI